MEPVKTTRTHERKTFVLFDPAKEEEVASKTTPFRKKKVAAYARVSTEQDAQQNSYEAQIGFYTDYIQSKPEWEFVGVYADEGISGTSFKKRDGFNRMVSDAKAGKIDLILTKSISRFARNTVDSLSITRDLKEHNVEVFFEKENISSMDSRAELIFTIMSSIAQEESRSISENVRWGKKRVMEAGKFSLAWSAFLGYTKGPDGLPVIVEEEAKLVRRIYNMYLEGHTLNGIARTLTDEGIKTPRGSNKWTPTTIRSILTNEKYKGDAILQKTFVADFLTKKIVTNTGQRKQWYVKDSHDAIIDPDVFDFVQEELAKRNFRKGKYYDSPFTGMVTCGLCGNYYGHRVLHSDRISRSEGWQCINKYKKGINCQSRRITEDEIKKAFRLVCNRLYANKGSYGKSYEETILPILSKSTDLEKDLAMLTNKKERLLSEAEALMAQNAKQSQSSTEYDERIKSKMSRKPLTT